MDSTACKVNMLHPPKIICKTMPAKISSAMEVQEIKLKNICNQIKCKKNADTEETDTFYISFVPQKRTPLVSKKQRLLSSHNRIASPTDIAFRRTESPAKLKDSGYNSVCHTRSSLFPEVLKRNMKCVIRFIWEFIFYVVGLFLRFLLIGVLAIIMLCLSESVIEHSELQNNVNNTVVFPIKTCKEFEHYVTISVYLNDHNARRIRMEPLSRYTHNPAYDKNNCSLIPNCLRANATYLELVLTLSDVSINPYTCRFKYHVPKDELQMLVTEYNSSSSLEAPRFREKEEIQVSDEEKNEQPSENAFHTPIPFKSHQYESS